MQKIRAAGVQDRTAPQIVTCVSKHYSKRQEKSIEKYKKNRQIADATAIMLDDAIQYLYVHFKKAATWRVTQRDDGQISKIPSTMRGNKVYAHYQSKRCEVIQNAIDKLIVFDKNNTNSLFITLTHQYNPKNVKSVEQSWQEMRKALPIFANKIRRLVTGYVITVEAHRLGGCHAHAQLILRKSVGMFEDEKEVWRCADEKLRQKIKQKWADSLSVPVAKAHCDIEAVHDENSARYVLKELKKVESCEQAVRNLKSKAYDDELSDRQLKQKIKDEKKVLAFYYAIKNKMRMLRVSKTLAKTVDDDKAEEEHDADWIELSNNTDIPKLKKEIVLRRSDIFRLFRDKDFRPYTGLVESQDELDIYKQLLDNKYRYNIDDKPDTG
jgi:hypothetical protein